MSQENKKSSWVVWSYIFLYEFMIVFSIFSGLKMPLDGATYALLFVVGGYCGLSQFAAFVASKKLPEGFKYDGNYEKLKYITIAMLFISISAIVSSGFNKNIIIPLDNLLLASGLVAGIFAGGNKLKVVAEGVKK